MPEREEGLNVCECPKCDGRGVVLTFHARFKTEIGHNDWERCQLCEGSGRVFVVPARVIGPYKAQKG